MNTAFWRDTLTGSTPQILVTILWARGSTPREEGTHMLVSSEQVTGTVGGGNLEFQAIKQARKMLEKGISKKRQAYPLGPLLGQCCGGHVNLMFERVPLDNSENISISDEGYILSSTTSKAPEKSYIAPDALPSGVQWLGPLLGVATKQGQLQSYEDITHFIEPVNPNAFPLYIFGAGHVGRAMVKVFDGLPFKVRWIDAREEEFPDIIPKGVEKSVLPTPVSAIEEAPKNALYLIFTHDHGLDFDLVEAILARRDARFIGLIGSHTKKVTFLRNLQKTGHFTSDELDTITCPIGLEGLMGKEPPVIAVSVAAQLMCEVRKPLKPRDDILLSLDGEEVGKEISESNSHGL